jgi:glutamine amidotransferase
MCIAILKPSDKTLDKDLLQTCADNNPDGCGFAYNLDDKIIIKKFMDFNSFWKEYSKVQEGKTMLIHFRIATHGNVELANCHPFKLNNHMALIHNGIISGYGSKTENLSDTRDFIDKVIGNISYKMWKNPSFIKLVEATIGYSKLVILDNKGKYYIINEKKGDWVDGVWYSNSSWKAKTKTVSATKPSTTTSPAKLDWGYIMRCPSCGKEKITQNWYEDVCDCKKQLECVGYIYHGERQYYTDAQFKAYNNKRNRYGYYDDYDYYEGDGYYVYR